MNVLLKAQCRVSCPAGVANSAVTLQNFFSSYGFTSDDIPNFKFLK